MVPALPRLNLTVPRGEVPHIARRDVVRLPSALCVFDREGRVRGNSLTKRGAANQFLYFCLQPLHPIASIWE